MQDCPQPSSESVSELCWSTAQLVNDEQQAISSDCAAAAVSLLSMTRPQSSLHLHAAKLHQQQQAELEAQASLCLPGMHASEFAVQWQLKEAIV